MVMTRDRFRESGDNRFFHRRFFHGSNLSPIESRLNELAEGLVQWEPEVREKGIETPTKITVEGTDYRGVHESVFDFFS